jgi:hypothetical protein
MSANLIHFRKEILSNVLTVKGRAVPFENIGANRGVIALDPAKDENKEFIAALTDFAHRGVGGVAKISADDYAQKKSHPALTPSVPPREMLRARPGPPAKRVAAPPELTRPGAVQAAKPAPPVDLKAMGLADDAEPQSFRPPTRKISRKPGAKAADAAAP